MGSIPPGADFFSNFFGFPSTPRNNETHFPYQYVKGYPFLSFMAKTEHFHVGPKTFLCMRLTFNRAVRVRTSPGAALTLK
jgi:hypothetical protein